jgi:hypothetical protein
LFLVGLFKNVLQIGGFSAESRAVIDDFAVDLAGCEIDKAQSSSSGMYRAKCGRKADFMPILSYIT